MLITPFRRHATPLPRHAMPFLSLRHFRHYAISITLSPPLIRFRHYLLPLMPCCHYYAIIAITPFRQPIDDAMPHIDVIDYCATPLMLPLADISCHADISCCHRYFDYFITPLLMPAIDNAMPLMIFRHYAIAAICCLIFSLRHCFLSIRYAIISILLISLPHSILLSLFTPFSSMFSFAFISLFFFLSSLPFHAIDISLFSFLCFVFIIDFRLFRFDYFSYAIFADFHYYFAF
jgi:hypothetical protein